MFRDLIKLLYSRLLRLFNGSLVKRLLQTNVIPLVTAPIYKYVHYVYVFRIIAEKEKLLCFLWSVMDSIAVMCQLAKERRIFWRFLFLLCARNIWFLIFLVLWFRFWFHTFKLCGFCCFVLNVCGCDFFYLWIIYVTLTPYLFKRIVHYGKRWFLSFENRLYSFLSRLTKFIAPIACVITHLHERLHVHISVAIETLFMIVVARDPTLIQFLLTGCCSAFNDVWWRHE